MTTEQWPHYDMTTEQWLHYLHRYATKLVPPSPRAPNWPMLDRDNKPTPMLPKFRNVPKALPGHCWRGITFTVTEHDTPSAEANNDFVDGRGFFVVAPIRSW